MNDLLAHRDGVAFAWNKDCGGGAAKVAQFEAPFVLAQQHVLQLHARSARVSHQDDLTGQANWSRVIPQAQETGRRLANLEVTMNDGGVMLVQGRDGQTDIGEDLSEARVTIGLKQGC